MRPTRFLLAAVAAAALVSANPAAAQAQPTFPGAGYVVSHVHKMRATFTIPSVACRPGQNTASIMGLISPAIGTGQQWNGTAVMGCTDGAPWYRIQAWVSGLGATYSVDPAGAGDLVQAQLNYARSAHPTITVTNLTTSRRVTSTLLRPSTVVASGVYGGSVIPNFSTAVMQTTANGGKPLAALTTTRHVLRRGSTVLVGTGRVWRDRCHNRLYFRHP